jgi:hypothetical protein
VLVGGRRANAVRLLAVEHIDLADVKRPGVRE